MLFPNPRTVEKSTERITSFAGLPLLTELAHRSKLLKDPGQRTAGQASAGAKGSRTPDVGCRLQLDRIGLDVMEYCLKHGMEFSITADLDCAVREAIDPLPAD